MKFIASLYIENFRYVSIVKEEGLEISQPALDPHFSEVHHQLTSRDSKFRVHRYLLTFPSKEKKKI